MNAKHIPFLAAFAAVAVFLPGCNTPVVNMTSPHVRANPSRIYTLTMNTRINDPKMLPDSLKAYVVIEGDQRQMTSKDYGDQFFEYDYAMPVDREEAKYFFVVKYDYMDRGLVKHNELSSGAAVYTLNVDNRYVLAMESARGPVGATVAVVGSNFLPQDRIVIGGVEAPTKYVSPNTLTFTVPAIPGGKNYAVELHSGAVSIPIDTFRVDTASFRVSPASVQMDPGAAALLTIDAGQRAPEGGLAVEVLTDVPGSVIMPAVVIPAGQNAATVRIQGGAAGAGSLHISAPGYAPSIVPINVSSPQMGAPAPVEPAPAPVTPATPPPAAAVQGS